MLLIVMLWTDAFRIRLLATERHSIAWVLASALLILDAVEPLWIEKNGLSFLLITLVHRRFLSSTEAVSPDHAMFDLGGLCALLILFEPMWLALIVWVIMAGLIMGRVKIRQHLVPLVGMLSLWWLVWAFNDISQEMGWRRLLDASLSFVRRWTEADVNPPALKPIEFIILAVVLFFSVLGFRGIWNKARAMERQLLNVLLWGLILFAIIRWLPYVGGSSWWMAMSLPISFFIARWIEGLRRLWSQELLLWLCFGLPFITLLI